MDTPDMFSPPTTLDVEGRDLAETIASIEARGGLIQRLDVTSISGYRLGIAWPSPAEKKLGDFYPPTGGNGGNPTFQSLLVSKNILHTRNAMTSPTKKP